jgi:dTDP-4-dehydrorhamnose 3,5-epimerase
MNRDDRGVFTEVLREQWGTGCAPVQWNYVTSEAGVLRGVHVHRRHADYLVITHGRASIGLCDLRFGSPTEGVATVVEMRGEELAALTIPPGVAHGFYLHEPSMQLYAVSEYWDPQDELGCFWSDPDLAIPWPVTSARISARDQALPSLMELRELMSLW